MINPKEKTPGIDSKKKTYSISLKDNNELCSIEKDKKYEFEKNHVIKVDKQPLTRS